MTLRRHVLPRRRTSFTPCVHSFRDRVADAHLAREGRRVRREVPCGAARDAPRGLRARSTRPTCSSASIRPTTRPCTGSTTSARSSSRSTSSRPSSTTRAPSARSRRRTRSTTSSRWAACRCSRSRSRRFPEELPTEMLGEILAGADEVVRAAGAILAGGHTIRDDEPKYGLAVVGTVHPDGIWPKSGARPGDALFLTKPLGTGLVLQAQREGRAPAGALEAAVAAMRTLNRDAADALRPFAPNAVTDVTGFGLLGHAHEMASRSGVRIELDAAALPALPSALELAEAGVRTGGDRRNREYAGPHVESTAADSAGGARLRPADGRWAARLAPRRQGRRARGHVRRSRARPLHRVGRVACRRRAWRFGEPRRARSLYTRGVRTKARARRRRAVSPRRFRPPRAGGDVVTLWVVVTSGAVVRLTASGLGCDNWPRCGDKPVPEKGGHARDRVRQPHGGARRDRALTLVDLARRPAGRRALPRWVRNVALVDRARDDRADPARRHHGPARSPSARGDVALPARAARPRAARSSSRSRRGATRAGSRRRPGPRWLRARRRWSASPPARCSSSPGAVATASGPHPGGAGHPAARARRSRTPCTSTCGRRRSSASASSSSASSCSRAATRAARASPRRPRAPRRARSPRWSSARSSTATPCRGGSSSSTSRSRRRSGR